MPSLSPAEFYAFDELRRRKEAIQTPQDQQRYDLDVWRMANEPGYKDRMGQIGERGRFMSGPFRSMATDVPLLASLALGSVIPGLGAGLGAKLLAKPVGAALRGLASAGFTGLGAGRLHEGLGRVSEGRPGGIGESFWGALDLIPAFGATRRLLRRGGRDIAEKSVEASTSPSLLDARKINIGGAGAPAPGRGPQRPPNWTYGHDPRQPPSWTYDGDPWTPGFRTTTGTRFTVDKFGNVTDSKIAEEAARHAATAGVAGATATWGVRGIREAIQQSNIIQNVIANSTRLGLLSDDVAKAVKAGDPLALSKAYGYGPEAQRYLKGLGLSDEAFEVSPGYTMSELQWVLNGRRNLAEGGTRKWLDGTDHPYPNLGQYFKNNELPYELQGHMDLIGLNYFRTHRILNKLGIDSRQLKTTDAQVKQWYNKLGERLRDHRILVHDRLKKGQITEKGFADELNRTLELACSNCITEAKTIDKSLEEVQKSLRMLPILGSLVGGTLGYTQGDDEETALVNAAAGAIAGGAGAGMLRAILRSRSATEKYQTWVFWSLLGRPAPAARANLGAVGGTAVAGFERALEGIFGGSPKKIAQGLGILKDIPVRYPGLWTKNILMDPAALYKKRLELVGKELAETGRLTGQARQATGRLSSVYSAGDVTAVEILKRHGVDVNEALRMTLTGQPSTKVGTEILDLLSTQRGQRGIVPAFKTTLSPFPRVSVIGAEEALKRVPGLGIAQYLTGRGGGLKPTSMPQALARSVSGLGTIKAGEMAYDQLPTQGGPDPRVLEVAKGAAGPGQAIFEGTRNFIRARQEGQGLPGAILNTAADVVRGQQPLGFRPASLLTSPVTELQRRMVPGIIGDIARPDRLRSAALRGEVPAFMSPLSPTGDIASRLGPLFAQIPWLSQKTLPPRFAPVTLTGQPRFATPEAQILSQSAAERGAPVSATKRLLSRLLFPTTQQATPPAADYRDPQLDLLRRAGLPAARETPDARVDLSRGAGRVVQTPESAAEIQRLRRIHKY
jgi:hypothetical protein